MSIAIITDSTCDLTAEELRRLNVRSIPLNVHFQGRSFVDWEEITPADIVRGVAGGAELPSTSQPSPAAFAEAYEDAKKAGATHVIVLTISSELSGTYQSAVLGANDAPLPVTVFDSKAASLGLGGLVRLATKYRNEGKSIEELLRLLEAARSTHFVLFSVGTLEYLQKGGRIGAASALLGGLLNIKPILGLENGKIIPLGKARGARKAQRELVTQFKSYVAAQTTPVVASFLHIQDEQLATDLEAAIRAEGVEFTTEDASEIGSVIAAHVGPGTYGVYAYAIPAE